MSETRSRFAARSFNWTPSVVACGAALLLCVSMARAEERESGDCVAAGLAYGSAMNAEKLGHLSEARSLLSHCAEAKACSDIVALCKPMADKVAAAMPTVVPLVVDGLGQVTTNVEIKVDGALLTSHLDGRSVPVDPGLHVFTFGTSAGVFATERIMVLEGQHNRPIAVTMGLQRAKADTSQDSVTAPAKAEALAPQASATPEASESKAPAKHDWPTHEAPAKTDAPLPVAKPAVEALSFVLGPLALASLAGAAVLTYWGSQDNGELERTCKPNCSRASVEHVNSLYIVLLPVAQASIVERDPEHERGLPSRLGNRGNGRVLVEG
jgi:hypothetical protein